MLKKMLSIMIALCVVLSLSACGGGTEMQQQLDSLNQTISRQENKIEDLSSQVAFLLEMLGIPDCDFADDSIIVEIKNEFHDKIFTVDDFTMIDTAKVEFLGSGMYLVEIVNKGKVNVLAATKILENSEFIKCATPNLINAPAV